MITPRTIVSVHIPKAAGTSLLKAWNQAYGEAAVNAFYGENPADPANPACFDPFNYFNEVPALDVSYRVYHGHFRPLRFLSLENAFFCVFIRHPIDVLLSIKAFWSRTQPTDPLHKYCKENELTIYELAQIPLLRTLLSSTYLSGFKPDRFDFIGSVDHYSQDIKRMSDVLGVSLDVFRENVTKTISTAEDLEAIRYDSDPDERERLGAYLRDDIALYEHLLTLRHKQV